MPITLSISDSFPSMESLRNSCALFAFENAFEYKVLKSTPRRYTIACRGENCSWRLHASTSNASVRPTIKTLCPNHECTGLNHLTHVQASKAVIAAEIVDKVQEQPTYRPKEILQDIRREQGVQISYKQAWRAKEKANEIINGSFETSYELLPRYCRQIVERNPNSTAFVETFEENHKFRRIFISYGASAQGFGHCRPILGLDGTHLKSRYLGILLTATAVDAYGALFPVAFGAVDAENDENWLWFNQQLHTVIASHAATHLEQPDRLVFLSDRQKGLIEGVSAIFPQSPHAYCLRHLEENMHKAGFKTPKLKSLLWEAARAPCQRQFNIVMDEIRAINPRCADWILATNPIHWAR